MNNLNIEKIQVLEERVLEQFDKFCQANGLTYYLAYGSLIGAIRHNGFIPWDDDIDVMMPRSDFERLLSYENINENINIASRKNRSDWPYVFAKCYDNRTEMEEDNYKSGTIGVYLDVFPLDGLPDSSVLRSFHLYYINTLHYLLITVQKKSLTGTSFIRGMVKKMIYPIAKLIGMKTLLDLIENSSKKFDYEKSKYVGNMSINVYMKKECYKKDWFANSLNHKFMDIFAIVPNGYHEVLTKIYGDYMKLPPEEKRVTHHSYKVRVLKPIDFFLEEDA